MGRPMAPDGLEPSTHFLLRCQVLRLGLPVPTGTAEGAPTAAEPAQLLARGLNSSQVAEPRITPRTSLHPPIATGGNMYLQRSQRTSASGAFW
jgi:hypothetical protein